MATKSKVIIACISVLVAFAVGRYSVPEKVRIEKQIVEVEKKSTKKEVDTDKHKETKIVEVTKSDGTKEVTTIITEDKNQQKKEADKESSSRSASEVSEVSRAGSRVSLSALAGSDLRSLRALIPVYGAAVSKEILGPITAGAFGFSNGMVGLSLGLNF